MFVELELFKTEKEQYASKILEINESFTNKDDLARKLEEASVKYKGQIRKFLPSALNIIKTVFGIDYSIYKVGKDFNSEFKVVETNVRKTKPEVFAEMNEFKLQAESMNLSADNINKLNLAMDVFITYSEDAEDTVDESKEDYMKYAKVTTSSIVSVPTRVNNAFDPVTTEIQHNPYANQVVDNSANPYANQPLEATGFKDDNYDNKSLLVDPFASIYNGTAPVQEITSVSMDNSNNIFQTSSIFSDQQQTNIQEPINNNQFNQQPNIQENNIQPKLNEIQFLVPGVNSNMEYGNNNKFVNTYNNVQVQNNQANQNNDDWKIKGENEEHPTLGMRIFSGILIPILSIIIAIIFIKGSQMPQVLKFMGNLLGNIDSKMFILICYLIIGILCLIFGTIIIAIAKSKTKHLGKFLILPSLITAALIYFLPEMLKFLIIKFNIDSIEIALYMIFGVYIALSFVSLLFIRVLFKKKDKSDRIKWNIAEIIGFIVLIYTVFIPTITMLIGFISNNNILTFITPFYNYNNSQYIMGGLNILFVIIIIVFNIREDKRL